MAGFNAHVRSIMEFGSVIWGGVAKTHLSRLERIQHKFFMWLAINSNCPCMYTRSIMNVSRARFTHSRQNGTLAESRFEEGSLTGSSAQPDTWRIPHSSPPFQPGTHTDRAITARGEGPQPAVFRRICCVSVQGRDGRGWGATSRRIRFQLNQSYD